MIRSKETTRPTFAPPREIPVGNVDGDLDLYTKNQLSSEKKNWLLMGCIGDEILPNYIGVLINQYKDHPS